MVCDVRPEATDPFRPGPRWPRRPAEAAAAAEVLLVAVVDDTQVREVVAGPDGVLAAGLPGRTVVVLSTVVTTTVAGLAAEAGPRGVGVVDCGVSGGPSAAAAGELVCMVGGSEEAFGRIRPVLDVLGSLVLHMGPLGAGLSAKLARNVVQYGSWLAAYEAQVLAEAAGIRLPLLAQAIRESDKRIGGAATLMFRDTARPLRPEDPADAGLVGPMGAAARLAHKDLGAAAALGGSLGVDLPLTRLTDERADRIFGMAGTAGPPPAGETGAPAAAEGDAGGDGSPRARGIAKMQEVYGFSVDPADVPGPYAAVTVDHLFGRCGPARAGRGAAQAHDRGRTGGAGPAGPAGDPVPSALDRGELDVDQVREVVLHLTHYVGWPLSTGMNAAAERVIARRERAAGEQTAGGEAAGERSGRGEAAGGEPAAPGASPA